MGTTWNILIIVLFIIVFSLVILNIRMLKLIGRYIQFVESMKMGIPRNKQIEKIPNMVLQSDLNKEVTLNIDNNLEKDLLLIFISPNCSACKSLYPDLKNDLNGYKDVFTMIVSRGESEENQKYYDHFKNEGLNYVSDKNLFDKMGVYSFPYAMYVRKDKKILAQGHPGDSSFIYKMVEKNSAQSEKQLIG
ncbi:thioredoxin fold domain-containing protein [Cytobacillus sp. IB215316]|uniref:thioredoxin fold domain-containing protein n=1 Tax=Cytobacillus sp. IB215316 TaxID=3097354 RepID=UPI002A1325BF|nr:thioredoxin fold domain-containing protein [Cytobacillus sp. IB215316]MDX8363287.1 thioredoxin fold domain-containing protein [Cytobacillus sp. IB215316]